jgi:hypothetical protein
MRELETVFEKVVEVTPRRFLALLGEGASGIEHVDIRPPRLGEQGFGRIVVEHRRGVFRPVSLGARRG